KGERLFLPDVLQPGAEGAGVEDLRPRRLDLLAGLAGNDADRLEVLAGARGERDVGAGGQVDAGDLAALQRDGGLDEGLLAVAQLEAGDGSVVEVGGPLLLAGQGLQDGRLDDGDAPGGRGVVLALDGEGNRLVEVAEAAAVLVVGEALQGGAAVGGAALVDQGGLGGAPPGAQRPAPS